MTVKELIQELQDMPQERQEELIEFYDSVEQYFKPLYVAHRTRKLEHGCENFTVVVMEQ